MFPHQRLAAWQPPAWTRIFFTGAPGEGKSHLLGAYVRNVYRVAAWDPKCEHPPTLGGPVLSAQEFFDCSPRLKRGVLRVSVVSRFGPLRDCADPPDPEAIAEDFDLYARGCWRAGALLALVEEISTTGAEANSTPVPLAMLANFGRDTRFVSLAITAQVASQLPAKLRAQASEWCAFRVSREEDAKTLATTFRGGADPMKLRKHQFVHWTPSTGPVTRGP